MQLTDMCQGVHIHVACGCKKQGFHLSTWTREQLENIADGRLDTQRTIVRGRQLLYTPSPPGGWFLARRENTTAGIVEEGNFESREGEFRSEDG